MGCLPSSGCDCINSEGSELWYSWFACIDTNLTQCSNLVSHTLPEKGLVWSHCHHWKQLLWSMVILDKMLISPKHAVTYLLLNGNRWNPQKVGICYVTRPFPYQQRVWFVRQKIEMIILMLVCTDLMQPFDDIHGSSWTFQSHLLVGGGSSVLLRKAWKLSEQDKVLQYAKCLLLARTSQLLILDCRIRIIVVCYVVLYIHTQCEKFYY